MDINISELPSYRVSEYNKDYVIDFIRLKTGWTGRDEVSNKPQLKYLFPYLEEDHIDVRSIVFENEYIDRNYLEDDSEYYVRCFNQHPKLCSRIHFFSCELDESNFISLLENEKDMKSVEDNYIGYIVIRPIPNTFLAKICIKPYKALLSGSEYKLITKPNKVSLFGIQLNVDTISLQEQDKVVAACATSALWVLLNASQHVVDDRLPSPSAITKSATLLDSDGVRTFPNKGLRPEQVAKGLKNFGLEPSILVFKNNNLENINQIKENIYAYLGNDIPSLLGGVVYRKNEKGNVEEIGRHLICILGYKCDKEYDFDCEEKLKLKSRSIDRLYAHDDRYGPYAKVVLDKVTWQISRNGNDEDVQGLSLAHHYGNDDLFSPDLLIIGHYHKIRITYSEIYDTCSIIHRIMSMYENVGLTKNGRIPPELKQSFDSMRNGVWNIELITNNNLKEELIKTKEWCSANGVTQKSDFLTSNMPRFIWRCQISIKGNQFTEILFDATEVPQGDILLGYISYSEIGEIFWQYIRASIGRGEWDIYRNVISCDTEKVAISSFIRFFKQPKGDVRLNSLYGPATLPNRILKKGETDQFSNVTNRMDLYYIRDFSTGAQTLSKFEKEKVYIWVIDIAGDLILGCDVKDGESYQGHPTLIDGRPARIGGELNYLQDKGKWVINCKSRSYSSHLKHNEKLALIYLQNVINHKFPNEVLIAENIFGD